MSKPKKTPPKNTQAASPPDYRDNVLDEDMRSAIRLRNELLSNNPEPVPPAQYGWGDVAQDHHCMQTILHMAKEVLEHLGNKESKPAYSELAERIGTVLWWSAVLFEASQKKK
jgi:hypothetical protein